MDLQGSETAGCTAVAMRSFGTIWIYKGVKPYCHRLTFLSSFGIIRIYKGVKRAVMKHGVIDFFEEKQEN